MELADIDNRKLLINRIDDIIRDCDERLVVRWRGQPEPCTAYVKDGYVAIVKKDGTFVTAFKEETGGNKRLNEARSL